MSIVLSFLTFQNQLKLYHWQTYVYARHKASDRLYKSISEKIDRFIEVLQGSKEERVGVNEGIPLNNLSDAGMVQMMKTFRDWLVSDLPNLLETEDTDLLNIRDEMLADINQGLYLFSLQ